MNECLTGSPNSQTATLNGFPSAAGRASIGRWQKVEAMMAAKTWTVRIKGIVIHEDARGRRVAAPPGQYVVSGAEAGEYLISGDGHPAFRLTAKDATRYIRGGDIDIESGGAWP
jgi:hypothetical protein